MLKVQNLKKYFGGLHAVDGCTFHIERGKITALIGPNGAGKSTVFNLICGNLKQDDGNIIFRGENLNGLSIHERAKIGISRTFQSVRIFKNLSIRDNMLLSLNRNDEKFWNSLLKKESNELGLKVQEIIKNIGLDKDLSTHASDLSYGQTKLLELGKALLFKHFILLLDEPVAGISPHLRDELKEILKELKKQNETILVIEHDMNFIFEVADHIIVMDEGKVLTEGSPSEIKNNPKVLEVYLGEQL